jgi:hypothetical protein
LRSSYDQSESRIRDKRVPVEPYASCLSQSPQECSQPRVIVVWLGLASPSSNQFANPGWHRVLDGDTRRTGRTLPSRSRQSAAANSPAPHPHNRIMGACGEKSSIRGRSSLARGMKASIPSTDLALLARSPLGAGLGTPKASLPRARPVREGTTQTQHTAPSSRRTVMQGSDDRFASSPQVFSSRSMFASCKSLERGVFE